MHPRGVGLRVRRKPFEFFYLNHGKPRSSLRAQGRHHAGTRSGLSVPAKGNLNATAYKDVPDNRLPTFWQQSGEEPQSFGHISDRHTFNVL